MIILIIGYVIRYAHPGSHVSRVNIIKVRYGETEYNDDVINGDIREKRRPFRNPSLIKSKLISANEVN